MFLLKIIILKIFSQRIILLSLMFFLSCMLLNCLVRQYMGK